MNKRGQISTIVIIAIAVVLTIILVFVIREFLIKTTFQEQYEKHLKVPLQIEPVRNYMDACVLKIASQGVDTLGQQGGYIEIPLETLPVNPYNPLSSFLEIFPNSGFRTALWFRETPNGIQTTEIPEIQDMEFQLEQYIENNINKCINNLTSFTQEGYTFEFKQKPSANIDIQDNVVDVILEYPLNILIKDLRYPLREHLAQIPVSLGKLHDLSLQILDSENNDLFFEKFTIDQLTIYDEIPFSGVDLTCVPKTWSKTNTINQIKSILSTNIQQIKIKGTDYELPNEDYEYFEFDALDDNYPEITANLLYSSAWPTLIEVTPSSGDLMRGSQISSQTSDIALSTLSSFFCLSDHHFVYDIKYPVLITLTDPSGYIFQFATQVIIDNNQPRQNQYEELYVPELEYSICDYPSDEITVTTLTPNKQGSLVPLENAEVVLKCYPEVCNLGTTRLQGGEARLTSNAPQCANAVIEARKQDYYSGKISLSTNEIQKSTNPIILEPYYKKQIIIQVIDKQNGIIRDPYDSEDIMFQFIHKPTGYTTALSTPIEEPIDLLVGDYEITSYIIGESTWPITYPASNVENCIDVRKKGIFAFFGDKEEKCFNIEIPETKLDSAIKGGVKFDYTFTREDLISNNPIKLYTIAQPLPSSTQELTSIYQSIETNSLDPRFKYPEI